jgi:hypothetical protein
MAQTCADIGTCENEGLQPITVPVGVPEEFDQFGKAVAIDGNRLVVGEQVGDVEVENAGSAHIYELVAGQWQHVQSVAPGATEGDVGDLFGGSAAIDGDVIVVGAKGDDDTGSASVFEWNGSSWAQVARLFAPTPQVGAELVHAIAVSGEWVVVGSHFEGNARGTDAGAVYFFRPK